MQLFNWKEMTGLNYFSKSGTGSEVSRCLGTLVCSPNLSCVANSSKGGNEMISHRSLLMVILPTSLFISLTFYFSEVCCPVPELKHGEITARRPPKKVVANKCEYFYGDSISYSCGERRNSEASCQGDGTWSPETPTCGESKSLWNDVILEVSSYPSLEDY